MFYDYYNHNDFSRARFFPIFPTKQKTIQHKKYINNNTNILAK